MSELDNDSLHLHRQLLDRVHADGAAGDAADADALPQEQHHDSLLLASTCIGLVFLASFVWSIASIAINKAVRCHRSSTTAAARWWQRWRPAAALFSKRPVDATPCSPLLASSDDDLSPPPQQWLRDTDFGSAAGDNGRNKTPYQPPKRAQQHSFPLHQTAAESPSTTARPTPARRGWARDATPRQQQDRSFTFGATATTAAAPASTAKWAWDDKPVGTRNQQQQQQQQQEATSMRAADGTPQRRPGRRAAAAAAAYSQPQPGEEDDEGDGWDPDLLHRCAEMEDEISSVAGLQRSPLYRGHVRSKGLTYEMSTEHRLKVYRALRKADPEGFLALLSRRDLNVRASAWFECLGGLSR